MNILIIASWYINENNIIRGSFFREQAIALKNAGHNVIVASVEQYATKLKNIKKCGKFTDYCDDGVRTIIYNQFSFGSGGSIQKNGKSQVDKDPFLERNLAGYRKIYKKLKSEGISIDIIHAHSFLPGGYCACRLKPYFDVPLIITEHTSAILKDDFSSVRKQALKYCIENAEGFYCVSKYLADSIIKITDTEKKEIGIIPNILSPLFYYNPDEVKFDVYTFISVGQLIPSKGMDILIDAFSKAFSEKDNVRLLIAGDGAIRDELQSQINKLGLANRITLLGRIERKQLSEIMRRSHAFVMMSRLETFGVVYIEALACGLPTIGTINGGSNDILDGIDCIRLDIDDQQGLIKTLKSIYNNEIQFDSANLSKEIIGKYGEKAIVNMIETAYKNALMR